MKWFERKGAQEVREFTFGSVNGGCSDFAFPPASTAARDAVYPPSRRATEAEPGEHSRASDERPALRGSAVQVPLHTARATGAVPPVDAAANIDIEQVMQRDDVAAAVEQRVAQRADERWNELVARVVDDRQRSLRTASTQVALVARAVARTLVGNSMKQDPDVVVAVAERALREAAGLGEATLFVHPDAVASVSQALAAQGAMSSARVNVLSDDALRYGDCRVETPRGNVECDQEEQVLRLVQQAFAGVRRSEVARESSMEEAV